MPAENPYLPALNLSCKIRCKSRWCNSCNSHGGLWPFTFTQNVHPVEGCFFPVKFPEFSCSPFAIHRHQSSIAKASDLRRKNIPWKKWETIWKGRVVVHSHIELKNKNLAANVNYEKPHYIRVKVGTNSSWILIYRGHKKNTTFWEFC